MRRGMTPGHQNQAWEPSSSTKTIPLATKVMADMDVKMPARQLEAEVMVRDGDLGRPLQGQYDG